MRLRGSNPYGRGQQAAWVSRGLRSGDVYEDQDVLLGEEDGSGRPICEVGAKILAIFFPAKKKCES
eukprot:390685-Amorphochlora_amoeboformis.AAC.1